MIIEDKQPNTETSIEHPSMEVDIACVGFGPAMAGFLSTLSKKMTTLEGMPAFESKTAEGMPLQVICYERADDLGFGVSGVVSKAENIQASLPELDCEQIPMAAPVGEEKLVYLLDPIGASRRSALIKLGDLALSPIAGKLKAFEIPFCPGFLDKKGGFVLSLGQFMQWAGGEIMGEGNVQIWPGSPVEEAIVEDKKVVGVRLSNQGVEKNGEPNEAFTPGMDIRAALTVVGDGPVGAVGRQLDKAFGMPEGHDVREWAIGMKFVVEMNGDHGLKPGMVIHTLGYPEPEIFGFFYVHPNNVVSLGIFVPSWLPSPARTAYRYLQHYMQHPYLWRYLEGGRLLSWGAKSLQESGRRGEPKLVGDGYARIGEGSGSTNILTNSGVDEAWATGVMLAEGVLEMLAEGKPFTEENLKQSYEARRRSSKLESESKLSEKARDGFHGGLVKGMIGMALTAYTRGFLSLGGEPPKPHEAIESLESYYAGRIRKSELAELRKLSQQQGAPLHDAIMDRLGWPQIPFDGSLLVSQQDALLMGGKVQAPGGYADHVRVADPALCQSCDTKVCVEICSGQAIALGGDGLPEFDREKCVFCGACLWNCAKQKDGENNLRFQAGAGGFHSAEN